MRTKTEKELNHELHGVDNGNDAIASFKKKVYEFRISSMPLGKTLWASKSIPDKEFTFEEAIALAKKENFVVKIM